MSSKPTFYYMLESPPCRTVIAVARALGIELELKTIDLSKKEQLNPEYLKINPFHVVPTLVDADGFVIWESRAIAAYLIQSRQPDSPLYPSNNLKERITIDKFLHYDLGTFYRAISDVVYGIFYAGGPILEKLPRLNEVLKTFDEFFAQNNEKFVSGGDQLTLADISLAFSATMIELCPEVNLTDYPSFSAWFDKVNEAMKPYNQDGKFDEARENMKQFAKMLGEKALAAAAEAATEQKV